MGLQQLMLVEIWTVQYKWYILMLGGFGKLVELLYLILLGSDIASSVSANTTSGLSVVTWTGTGVAGTVGTWS
jgi:hypothetical protein